MESALAAKDREIRKLQEQVETMREQSSIAMRKDEALEQITRRVDSILHNQLGDVVADRRRARQPQTLKSLLGEGSAFETIEGLASSIVSASDPNYGDNSALLSASLPSLDRTNRGDKSYITLSSSGGRVNGPSQPAKWRPAHRKKAHEHMKSKAITSDQEPSPWSDPAVPDAFSYQNGREAALKPLGVMASSVPTSPVMTGRPRAQTIKKGQPQAK